MMDIVMSSVLAFVITMLLTPYAIRYFRIVGVTTSDLHKKNKPILPASAGIPVTMGVIGGLLFFIFMNVFLVGMSVSLVTLFAAITSIFLVAFSGFLDDLNSSQSKKGKIHGKIGLKSWQKPLLTFPAALPLMAIMAGTTSVTIPFLGIIDLGILYPLVAVPIGIVGASNMVNMLGGFNGLEAGMGIIYTFGLGLFALMIGSLESSVIFFVAMAALLAAIRYNFTPAKILPGDSLTYMLGAVIVVGAVIGNLEKIAIIMATPFLIQGVLKIYSRVKLGHFAADTGILQKDGTIKSKYGKSIYSWTHIMMRFGNMTERKIVLGMIGIQAVFVVIPFINHFYL